jgi:dipeptidyl-peptidase-4
MALHDPETGETEVILSAVELIPGGERTPLRVQGRSWTQDLSKVLIYTNSERVWRSNTRGDYWVLDRSARQLRQLGGDAAPSSLMFAKFSPDGRHVAFVRERNIYVEDLLDHSIRQLTQS